MCPHNIITLDHKNTHDHRFWYFINSHRRFIKHLHLRRLYFSVIVVVTTTCRMLMSTSISWFGGYGKSVERIFFNSQSATFKCSDLRLELCLYRKILLDEFISFSDIILLLLYFYSNDNIYINLFIIFYHITPHVSLKQS